MSNIKVIMESWRRYKKSLLREEDDAETTQKKSDEATGTTPSTGGSEMSFTDAEVKSGKLAPAAPAKKATTTKKKKAYDPVAAAKATQLRVLRKVFKNKQSVKTIQQALVAAGPKYEKILKGPKGTFNPTDNDYGQATYNAITTFQKDYIAKAGKGSLGNYGNGGVDGVVGGLTMVALGKAAPKSTLQKAITSLPAGTLVKGEQGIKDADKVFKAKGPVGKEMAARQAVKNTDAIEKAAEESVSRQSTKLRALFKKLGIKFPEFVGPGGMKGAFKVSEVEAAADAAVKAKKMTPAQRQEVDALIAGGGKAGALYDQQRKLKISTFQGMIRRALQGTDEYVKDGSPVAKRYKRVIGMARAYADLGSTPGESAKEALEYINNGGTDPLQLRLVDPRVSVASFKKSADELFAAMDGAGTDEEAIYKILARAKGPGKVKLKNGKVIEKGDALRRAFGTRNGMTLMQMLADELNEEEYRKAMDQFNSGLGLRREVEIFIQMNR